MPDRRSPRCPSLDGLDRYRHLRDDIAQDALDTAPAQTALGGENNAMREDRCPEFLDVLRRDVIPPTHGCVRLGGTIEGERAARRGTEGDRLMRPRAPDDPRDVLTEFIIDMNRAHLCL